MKKFIYAFASIALVALVGLASCKKESKSSDNKFKLNYNSYDLSVGETAVLEAQNASGAVAWSVDNGNVAITPNGNSCTVEGKSAGISVVSCTCGGETLYCEIEVEGAKEDMPDIAAPTGNNFKLAVRAPQGVTCNKVRAAGNFNSYNDNDATQNFEAVPDTKTWYVKEYATADVEFLKVLGIDASGKSSWNNQWSKTEGEVVVMTENDGLELNYEENGECRFHILTPSSLDGKVIYVDIISWNTNPCEPVNPEGAANFTFKNIPAEIIGLRIVGGWPAESEYGNWNTGQGLDLTKDANGNWTASGIEVPGGFEFKALFIIEEGADYDWARGFKGNAKMSLDNNYVNEYDPEQWQGLE